MSTREIEQVVRSLGIGATYQGYHFLIYGVNLCLQDDSHLISVSKMLYPKIANTFGTSASCVERNIRTVIQICWDRGYKGRLEQIACHPVKARPTAKDFIDIIVEYLKDK